MTEQITIRKAIANDLAKLIEFEQEIITAERPFDSTLKPTKISYYDLSKMIDATDVQIVVAEKGLELIGSGYARIVTAKPYLNHENYAYLGFMYTHPNHRGKGINASIIKELQNWCALQNIFEIRLDVYHENGPAIKAYEKAGFKKHLVNMRLASY